jgi:molecular chaperone HtpG
MTAGQEAIWTITGADESSLRSSPHLEAVRARGEDVVILTDPVDEWVLQSVREFDGKPLRSVSQGRLDAGADSTGDDEEGPDPGELGPLIEKAKTVLGERVRNVRVSERLTSSASCLVDAADALPSNMERLLRAARPGGGGAAPRRILELNRDNPIVAAAAELARTRADDPELTRWIELLHDLASLAEGTVPDPAATVGRLQEVLARVARDGR